MSYSLYIEEAEVVCFVFLPASLLSELNWCIGDSITCSEAGVLGDRGHPTVCVLLNLNK